MRSLFSFPLPCTTTLAATVPLQPEMSHRPHPAPVRRSPALLSAASPLPGPALTGPRPTVTRSQGARHAAPPHPCLAPPPAPIAPHHLSTAPLPPAPIGLASSTSRPSRAVAHIASTPLRAAIRIPLCRHRADPARIAAPSHPPRAAVRVPLSRCVGPGPLAGENRTACIPFSPNARKRPSSWQHPPEMHAFRDQDGNILALCIHFRAQSGDSGYMARESCRQGPSFATRNPKSRMTRRCCQRRAAFPRQRPAVRPNGLCAMRQRHGRTGFAPCGAGLACLLHAPPPVISLVPAAACAPCHLACACRPCSSPPSYTRHASPPASRPRTPPSAAPPIAVGMSCRSGSSCRPRAAHADASRYLRAAPIPPAAQAHRVQETSGTTQATQCEHKNRIPKWGPY